MSDVDASELEAPQPDGLYRGDEASCEVCGSTGGPLFWLDRIDHGRAGAGIALVCTEDSPEAEVDLVALRAWAR